MDFLSVFKRVGLIAFILFLVVALYVFTSCSDCLFRGVCADKLILLVGIIFCASRLIFVIVGAWKRTSSWLQTILPFFVLIQLILSVFDIFSSLLVLGTVAVAEILIVSAAIIISVKFARSDNNDKTLVNVLRPLLPPGILRWVLFEITLISSALFGLSRFFRIPEAEGWSYWRKSAFPLIFLVVFFLGPIELIVAGYVLGIESLFVHSLLALFFVWSMIYVYGFWVSIKLAPHRFSEDKLFLNRGALGTAVIPIQAVESVQIVGPTERKLRSTGNMIDLRVPGTPSVELLLSKPTAVMQIFDEIENLVDRILVSVDEPQLFCREILRLRDAKNLDSEKSRDDRRDMCEKKNPG